MRSSMIGARASHVCVLLVEDELLIREVMSESLQDAGYQVMEVENGDLALEMRNQPPCDFRLLVTDFHMPGLANGSAVAARMRAINPKIPVVIASGQPEVLQSTWQRDHGYELLKKPYLPSQLLAIVRSLIGPPGS